MPKIKKKPEVKYGIQITKPFSVEMYDHNKGIATTMNVHIDAALTRCITCEPIMEEKLRDIAHSICGVGFGEGYSLGDIHKEAEMALLNLADWRMNEEYEYLCYKGYVPKLEQGMVGFSKVPPTYLKEEELI